MAKARMVSLEHRSRWFLGHLAGMLRPGADTSLDGLNRAGLRHGAECLRVAGRLPPHGKGLPDVADVPGRGKLEDGDEVRLGDADQELLGSLRPCWVDGQGLSWANLNNRTLRLAEDFVRYLAFIGDYPGESVFDRLVPLRESAVSPVVPIQPAETVASKTVQKSEDGSNGTDKESKNEPNGADRESKSGSDQSIQTSDTESENPAKGSKTRADEIEKAADADAKTSVEGFVWDPEADGPPSDQEMQFKGTCAGCGKEHPKGAPKAIRFPTSKRWLVLNCCGVAEAFLEEQAKAGGSGNGRRKSRLR